MSVWLQVHQPAGIQCSPLCMYMCHKKDVGQRDRHMEVFLASPTPISLLGTDQTVGGELSRGLNGNPNFQKCSLVRCPLSSSFIAVLLCRQPDSMSQSPLCAVGCVGASLAVGLRKERRDWEDANSQSHKLMHPQLTAYHNRIESNRIGFPSAAQWMNEWMVRQKDRGKRQKDRNSI